MDVVRCSLVSSVSWRSRDVAAARKERWGVSDRLRTQRGGRRRERVGIGDVDVERFVEPLVEDADLHTVGRLAPESEIWKPSPSRTASSRQSLLGSMLMTPPSFRRRRCWRSWDVDLADARRGGALGDVERQ